MLQLLELLSSLYLRIVTLLSSIFWNHNFIDVDFETLRNSKRLQALVTCDVLAIRTTGDDLRIFESTNSSIFYLEWTLGELLFNRQKVELH
jgi:hypothetical protein